MPSNHQSPITSTHDIQEIDNHNAPKSTVLSPSSSIINNQHSQSATTPKANQSQKRTTSDELGENTTTKCTAHTADQQEPKQAVVCESIEDRYFPVIVQHIGAYNEFTTVYTKSETVIGCGAECTVYHGTNNTNNEEVAILEYKLSSKLELVNWFAKYLTIKQCDFYSVYEAFIGHTDDEIATLSKFTVFLVQELLDKNVTQIMTDIAMQQHDVDEHCTSESTSNSDSVCINMDEPEIQAMIFQIVQQLNTLTTTHKQCHLDIKPTNIMRRRRRNNNQQQNEYTLIDFGFAMECNTSYRGYVGTKTWSAPEMKPELVDTVQNIVYESTDMWSIGLLILYCLNQGTHPFMEAKTESFSNGGLEDIQKWYNECMQGKQCFIESWLAKQLMLNKISYHLFDFVFKCLRFDPCKRLTPNQALQHKWLTAVRQS